MGLNGLAAAKSARVTSRPVELLIGISAALAGYLTGAVPTGYWVGRARGVDIRKLGSGNIGATNVFRFLGKPAGVFVLLVDGLKGYAACVWIANLVLMRFGLPDAQAEPYRMAAGIAAVLGHNFTFWLGFKGGKGIATSAGVFLALAPAAVALAAATWIVAFVLSRYVSVASILAAAALPIAAWLLPNSLPLRLATLALGLLAIWKHKANITRLLNGTEHRFGRKPAAPEAAS
jgi:acyl phosphate:glycerol-3-phosphate acyltransferase